MNGWLLAAVVAIALVVFLGWRLLQHSFAGAGEELGRRAVESLADWSRRRSRHRAAQRAVRAGKDAPSVLSLIGGPVAGEARADLHRRFTPTPEVAALLDAIDGPDYPFSDRSAVMVIIGPGAEADIQPILAQTGRDIVRSVFAVEMNADATRSGTASGEELGDEIDRTIRTACDEAEESCAFLAIALRPPLTGYWDLDASIEPSTLLERLLGVISTDVWLTVRDPSTERAWPTMVTVLFPMACDVIVEGLTNSGYELPPDANIGDDYISLSGSDAARMFAALCGVDGLANLADAPSRRYSPAVTLAITADGASTIGVVRRENAETEAIQAFLGAAGIRVLRNPTDEFDLKLPWSAFAVRTVAWRTLVPEKARSTASRPPERDLVNPMGWLEEAIEADDEGAAASVLADHARAWLELHDPQEGLRLIRGAHEHFERGSRAFLWSHYLLALDSALRLEDPSEAWFTGEICGLASETELELLFRVERMEFARLRGNLDDSVRYANDLLPSLLCARHVSASERYVAGTSCYVMANLLRRGGRYELAKEFISRAQEVLDPAIESHRIELTHAIYGMNVCDSMFGVAAVHQSEGWSTTEAVFGRSLITLSNCHASWFVGDYERAASFASEAAAGFASIDYARYARRADGLRSLLLDWARRLGRPVPDTPPTNDPQVDMLLAVPPGASVTWLADLRPSKVLSLLQFCETFGSATTDRQVWIPSHILVDDQGSLMLCNPPPAGSFAEAAEIIRNTMGLGGQSRIPLAAD